MRTKSTHGVVNDPTRLLRRADAPKDLIAWTGGRALDDLWDECDRGDWLIWLAIIQNVPAVAIVEAAVACARRAVKALPRNSKRKPLTRAVRAARDLKLSQICAKRAKVCEGLARDPDAGGYREKPRTTFEWAASAAASAARAAEALLGAEARRNAKVDYESRIRAAGIGGGDSLIAHRAFPPLAFGDDDELVMMSLRASELTVSHAVRALAPLHPGGEQLEIVEGELSEIVYDVLNPVLVGLRNGVDAMQLVRKLEVEPYGATLATQEEAGSELETLRDIKKPLSAAVAALVIPMGGSGHLYAKHTTAGAVLSACGIASLMGSSLGTNSPLMYALIVGADLLTAPRAARRHNDGAISNRTAQIVHGVGVVVLAFLLDRFSGF